MFVAVIAGCAALSTVAAPTGKPKGGPRAAIEAQGGMVERMGDGSAIAVFYPEGEKAAAEAAGRFASKIMSVYGFATRIEAYQDAGEFGAALADKARNAGVLWIGRTAEEVKTRLVVAPEGPWARLDLDALAEGADDKALEVRIHKELWRGFAIMMGAAETTMEGCLLKSVLSAKELDALADTAVCPEPYKFIRATAERLGVGLMQRATYAKALAEGWAPEPVNDVQRKLKQEAEAGGK